MAQDSCRVLGRAFLVLAAAAAAPPPRALRLRQGLTRLSGSSRASAQAEAPADWAALLAHPAMWESGALAAHGTARRKLSRRHAADFGADGSLFDRIARACCETGVLPRKELFETWAVALRIEAHFPGARRVADVGSGHGLLAWMLLLLDSAPPSSRPRTAVCIDRRMPASAEKIEQAMLRAFPQLESRWQFVEADAAQLEPHPSCVLAAVHACGGLSDALVELAIAARAPVALVPCCHSFKRWVPHALLLHATAGDERGGALAAIGAGAGAGGEFAPFAHAEGEERRALVERVLAGGERSAADFIDGARVAALQAAGFAVARERIPVELTAKNRLLLARPPSEGGGGGARPTPMVGASAEERAREEIAPSARRAASPRLVRAAAEPRRPRVPLADLPAAISACAALSGRERADARKARPPPTLDLSLWLPPQGSAGPPLSARALETLAERVCAAGGGAGVAVRALALDVFERSDGRRAQTFRLEYVVPRPTERTSARAAGDAAARREAEAAAQAAERELALGWHMALQEEHIASHFPGAEVRGSELLARQRAERRARMRDGEAARVSLPL